MSVHNKPSRISDLQELVNNICSSQTVAISTLETLRGRLLYAAGHTFGRCTQLAIQLISRVARRGPLVLLDEQLKGVVLKALQCLIDSKPRRVEAWSGRPPIIMFTDGACEDEGNMVTHGATMFGPESNLALMFGDEVPSIWTHKWKAEGRRQLICQAELFPVLIAKNTWKSSLRGRSILWLLTTTLLLLRSFDPIPQCWTALKCL